MDTLINEEIPVYLVGGDVRTLAGISSGIELPESGSSGDIFLLYNY